MKRLEISKLMDEYVDNEFFPEGGTAADAQAVKNRVLTQAVAPAKRRRRPLKLALLAATLAVGCVLCIAAGIPGMAYRLLSGTVELVEAEKGYGVNFSRDYDPVQAENGRVFFVQDDGQRTDITDLISMETPYIYDDSNPSAGTIHYLMIGGTPEYYGWLEWFQAPQPSELTEKYHLADGNISAFNVEIFSEGHHSQAGGSGPTGCSWGLYSPQYRYPWLENALDTLGILIDDPSDTFTGSGLYFVDNN